MPGTRKQLATLCTCVLLSACAATSTGPTRQLAEAEAAERLGTEAVSCHSERRAGTNIAKWVCMTDADRARKALETQDAVQDYKRRSVFSGS